MLFKVLSSATLATVLSATLLGAQTLASIGGPANLPPPGFTGQQFVDSRGCLFLRAGFGAQVNWVPRVSRDRKPVCGMPPTFGAAAAAAVEASMAPEAPEVAATPVAPVARPAAPVVVAAAPAAPAPVAAPTRVVIPAEPPAAPRRGGLMALLFGNQTRSAPVVQAPVVQAPVVQAPVVAAPVQTASSYVTVDLAGPASGQIRCHASAPQLQRVLLRSGGTALVCTPGNGTLSGWRPPVFPNGAPVGAALSDAALRGATLLGGNGATATAATVARNAVPKPPKGYKLAWTDDRLNPLRGVGTAQGQAQQDQVWTRDIPAELVADQPKPRATTTRTATVRAPAVTVSTMSAPAAEPVAQPARAAASYVQVGTFGQPANAEGAKARLAALGFPVSTSKITRSGKVLQIVYAGPFATAAQAQSALATARGAGFGDAILR